MFNNRLVSIFPKALFKRVLFYFKKGGFMSNHTSKLVRAMQGWNEALRSYTDPPTGVFGRRAIIESWAVTLDSDEIDFDFVVKFDDDLEANECEITVYNLSKNTIKNLLYNKPLTITAGYKGDTGVIFKGYISKVKTKKEGCDKVTTIYCLDSFDLQERDLANVTYAAGTTASYILKDLINKTHLPIAVFEPRRNHTYEDEVSISSGLMDSIREYSEVCGISTYINNGKVYAQHISKGTNGYFNLNVDTGLINSPSEYEEEITAEDYSDTVKGLEIECLLQHRITTGSVVKVTSNDHNGEYRVRSGTHTFSPDEAITKIKVM